MDFSSSLFICYAIVTLLIYDNLNFNIYYQNFIYSPTDAPVSSLKKTILKFTLKQLRHVSVLQLHHHQGAH